MTASTTGEIVYDPQERERLRRAEKSRLVAEHYSEAQALRMAGYMYPEPPAPEPEPPATPPANGHSSTAVRNKRIREWARAKGIAVKDRGALPADVVTQYELSNPGG
jgi:hypothetical protein